MGGLREISNLDFRRVAPSARGACRYNRDFFITARSDEQAFVRDVVDVSIHIEVVGDREASTCVQHIVMRQDHCVSHIDITSTLVLPGHLHSQPLVEDRLNGRPVLRGGNVTVGVPPEVVDELKQPDKR